MSRQFREIRPDAEHDPQRVRWFLMLDGRHGEPVDARQFEQARRKLPCGSRPQVRPDLRSHLRGRQRQLAPMALAVDPLVPRYQEPLGLGTRPVPRHRDAHHAVVAQSQDVVARAPLPDEDGRGGHPRHRHRRASCPRSRHVGQPKLRIVGDARRHPAMMPRGDRMACWAGRGRLPR